MHVSVNIQNNVEKDTTLWLFVFSSPELRAAIQFSSTAFGLPYLLIELFYIGVPVVRTVGRTYGHVTSKISRMHRLPNFLTHGAPLREHRARESSSKRKLQNIGVVKAKKTLRQQYSYNDDGKYPKFLVMFLNGVIGYQSPNSQGVARTSPLSPIMKLENEKTEGTRLRGNLKANCWEKHVRTFMEVYLSFRPTLNWFQKPQTTAVNTRGWPRILTTKFIFWLFEISS